MLLGLALLAYFVFFGRSGQSRRGNKTDRPVVDRDTLDKLRLLEAHIGRQNANTPGKEGFQMAAEEWEEAEEDPDEVRYRNHKPDSGAKAPRPLLRVPEPQKVPKPIPPTGPQRKEPQQSAVDWDPIYCPEQTGCRFILPAFIGEQETKGQQHLYQMGLLAVALNRTLVLPNVVRSRLGSCFANPFSYYYAPDSLDVFGFNTITQARFLEWANIRDPAPTAQIVSMLNNKKDYPEGAIEIDSTSDSTLVPSKPDRKLCLQAPRSWLNFTQHSPLTIFPPESWNKQEVSRLSFGEGVVNTLRSPEVQMKAWRGPKGDKKNPVPVQDVDVLVMNYEIRYPILSVPSLGALATPENGKPIDTSVLQPFSHFSYSPTWLSLSESVAMSLRPYIAIHWRQEMLPIQNLMPCANSLLDVLRDISARLPHITTVYLATDYPIEDLEAGKEGTVAHSGTFARLITEDHHRAMRSFLNAFRKQQVGRLSLTTYEREHKAGRVSLPAGAEEGVHVDLGALDSGLLGIVDKNIAMAAEVFVTGAPGVCGKESSFTRQIVFDRQTRFEEQVTSDNGEVVTQPGKVIFFVFY